MDKKTYRAQVDNNQAKERIGCVDPYGFERSKDFDYSSYEEIMSQYLGVLTRRSIKWSKLLKGKNRVQKNVKLKRYVRKGIPNEHRTLIWMMASGAQDQLEKNPGFYQALLSAQQDPKLLETIRTDLNRTFPDNISFRKTSDHCLLKSLYNVLRAYGHHNSTVGYCQIKTCVNIELSDCTENANIGDYNVETFIRDGDKHKNSWADEIFGMNFIAGYLLIITKDEEKSFWLMDALIGRILPDYYSPAMLGLKTDQEVLGELVRLKAPGVWRTMTENNVMWTLVVSRWFICLYIDVLPVETVLRIWDCLFYEGSKILFRVALTLIHQHQAEIQTAQSLPDICEVFKRITHGAFVDECHPFMQKIFTETGSLSMTTLTKLRTKCRAQFTEES